MDGMNGKIIALLAYADYFIAGLIGLSVLISLIRGFVRESLALSTWVVAIWGAIHFGHRFSLVLTPHIPTPSLRIVVSYALIFFCILIVGSMAASLLAGFIKKSALSGTDRILGGVFGLLRGALFVTLLVIGAQFTPLPKDPLWRQSNFLPHFEVAANWIASKLPTAIGIEQHQIAKSSLA